MGDHKKLLTWIIQYPQAACILVLNYIILSRLVTVKEEEVEYSNSILQTQIEIENAEPSADSCHLPDHISREQVHESYIDSGLIQWLLVPRVLSR
jgi:hypothetical protein